MPSLIANIKPDWAERLSREDFIDKELGLYGQERLKNSLLVKSLFDNYKKIDFKKLERCIIYGNNKIVSAFLFILDQKVYFLLTAILMLFGIFSFRMSKNSACDYLGFITSFIFINTISCIAFFGIIAIYNKEREKISDRIKITPAEQFDKYIPFNYKLDIKDLYNIAKQNKVIKKCKFYIAYPKIKKVFFNNNTKGKPITLYAIVEIERETLYYLIDQWRQKQNAKR
jgi:hypothetical protein